MTFATIQEMKAFCAENNIVPEGNKSYRQTWQDAIDTYMEVQAEVIAMAVDAEIAATESAESIETAIVSAGSLIVALLTSDEAIQFYRGVLKFVVFAVIITGLFAASAAKWCWEHRTDTAVYHWVSDWLDSQHGRSIVSHILIGEWVVMAWVDVAVEWRDRVVGEMRDRTAIGLGRLGLG